MSLSPPFPCLFGSTSKPMLSPRTVFDKKFANATTTGLKKYGGGSDAAAAFQGDTDCLVSHYRIRVHRRGSEPSPTRSHTRVGLAWVRTAVGRDQFIGGEWHRSRQEFPEWGICCSSRSVAPWLGFLSCLSCDSLGLEAEMYGLLSVVARIDNTRSIERPRHRDGKSVSYSPSRFFSSAAPL